MPTVASVSELQNRLLSSEAQFSEAAIPNELYVQLQDKSEEFIPARRDIFDMYNAAYDSIRMTSVSTWLGFGSGLQLPTDDAVLKAESVISYGDRIAQHLSAITSDANADRIADAKSAMAAKLPTQILDPGQSGTETFYKELAAREQALKDTLVGNGGLAGILLGKGTISLLIFWLVVAFAALVLVRMLLRVFIGL